MSKQSDRAEILSQIDAKRDMAEVLIKEAQSLARSLPEQWVCRRTVLVQRTGAWGSGPPAGSQTFYGSRNPGTAHYLEGFLFDDPTEEGVQVFKTPDAAKLHAQCAADKDRGFDRQAWYKIEVVDRVDGEVLCEISERSEYIKAIDRGEPLSVAAKFLRP